MKKSLLSAAAAVALAVTLTACGSEADEDRTTGTEPDELSDTTNVILYRNANRIPNVAYFCAGEYGWASTLSGTDSAGSKAAALVRFPEYDKNCSAEPR